MQPENIRKQKPKSASELRKERALLPVNHTGAVFSAGHQLFIAKLKRGEIWALNHLSVEDKAAITPVFEMEPPKPPRPAKPKPGQKSRPAKAPKGLSEHARDLLTLIDEEWRSLPFFLDTQYIPKGGIPTGAAVKVIFDEARLLRLPVTPVTALRFTQSYQAEIANVITQDQRGVMVRLRTEDFTNPSLLPGYLEAIQQVLGVKPEQVDILVDLKHRPSQAEVSALGQSFLKLIPQIDEWRTLSLAAGCFPSSISAWKTGQWISIARSDWLGWNDVCAARKRNNLRLPTYGDYGVRCGGEPLDAARRPDPNLGDYMVDKSR